MISMKDLIKEYEDKLKDVEETIELTANTGSQNHIGKMARLRTTASNYRDFIDKLTETERTVSDAQYKELGNLVGKYYHYKSTDDEKIRKHLKRIKIVKMEKHAGGKITKFYPLNEESMKKIMEKPRNVSLTFDATEVSTTPIEGLEFYKTVTYLCKSTSRFFLKPDIGEIFDAIEFTDLLSDKIDAICFDNDYQTLPNSDGEHHIMHVNLYINYKARRIAERDEAINKLNQL